LGAGDFSFAPTLKTPPGIVGRTAGNHSPRPSPAKLAPQGPGKARHHRSPWLFADGPKAFSTPLRNQLPRSRFFRGPRTSRNPPNITRGSVGDIGDGLSAFFAAALFIAAATPAECLPGAWRAATLRGASNPAASQLLGFDGAFGVDGQSRLVTRKNRLAVSFFTKLIAPDPVLRPTTAAASEIGRRCSPVRGFRKSASQGPVAIQTPCDILHIGQHLVKIRGRNGAWPS